MHKTAMIKMESMAMGQYFNANLFSIILQLYPKNILTQFNYWGTLNTSGENNGKRPQYRQANRNHLGPYGGVYHPFGGAHDWRSSGYDHAAWREGWARLHGP